MYAYLFFLVIVETIKDDGFCFDTYIEHFDDWPRKFVWLLSVRFPFFCLVDFLPSLALNSKGSPNLSVKVKNEEIMKNFCLVEINIPLEISTA